MIGGDVAGLAFEVGAEIDDLVAGVRCQPDRGVERGLRPRDQFEIARAQRRDRPACSFRSPASSSARADGVVDLETVFRDDARGHPPAWSDPARSVPRRSRTDRRAARRRSPASRSRRGCAGARQPAALDPRQMLAHGIDLADRRARAQQRAGHLLLLRERHAFGRRDPVGRAAAGQQHQQQVVGAGLLRQPQRCPPRPSARPRRARDGRLRSP